jgi:hypothetical protein
MPISVPSRCAHIISPWASFLSDILRQTTIRILGGLLAAYHFSSGDHIYLERAKELADRLLPAFDTSSGLPLPNVNLKLRRGVPDASQPSLVSTAEVATLQLEFRYLSWLTDDAEPWEKVERVCDHCLPGFVCVLMRVLGHECD